MAVTYTKPALTVGVKDAYIRLVVSEKDGTVTYDEKVVQNPTIKTFKIAVEQESKKVSGSNQLYTSISGAKSVTVTLDLIAVDEELKAKILGRELTSKGSYSIGSISTDGRPQAIAFTTEIPTENGYIFVSIPNMKATKEVEEEYKDMYEGYEDSTLSFEFACMNAKKDAGELVIFTSEISKADAEKVRTSWHESTPKTNEEVATLMQTALSQGTK